MSYVDKRFKMRFFIIYFFICFIIKSYAHSGRTNSQGCHNNRRTGGYHCHNSYKKRIKYLIPKKENSKKRIIDINSLHKEARKGQSDSQLLLGIIYFIGKNVPKDLKKSSNFLNQSMKNGNLLAKKILENKNSPKIKRPDFKNLRINTLYVPNLYLEIEKEIESDEKWLIDDEIYEAKTYCFGLYEGDRIKFIEGTPGVCVSAKFIKENSNDICEVWCE